jgi:methyl-accepting chemotaxis protein
MSAEIDDPALSNNHQYLIGEFAEKEQILQERIWSDTQISQFDEFLRLNYAKSVQDFSHTVLQNICEMTQAYSGVFYLSDTVQSQVKAIAGYACIVAKLPQQVYLIGEGLVGQAAESKKTIFFNDIHTDAIHLKTDAHVPVQGGSLIVIPLVFNDIAYGALELFYIRSLEQKFREILRVLAKNIASTLESILNNTLTQQLLKDSQEQANALRSQEEEMRQHLEELQATQEDNNRIHLELENTFNILNTVVFIFEFGLDKKVSKANKKVLDFLGYTESEIIGITHDSILPQSKQIELHQEGFWKKLLSCEPISGEFEMINAKGEKMWLKGTYYPAKNIQNQVTKIIKIAYDITEEKQQKIKLIEQQAVIEQNQTLLRDRVKSVQTKAYENIKALKDEIIQKDRIIADLEALVNNTK